MYRGDICDKTLLQFLFKKYNFSHVVHMAAQGGVRHSMKVPHEYLGNVNCFLSLLEVVRDHQVTTELLRLPLSLQFTVVILGPIEGWVSV